MAVTLRYFTEFGKPALQKTMCGGIYAMSIVFLVREQCRRKGSSRSLSHRLMSFLYYQWYDIFRNLTSKLLQVSTYLCVTQYLHDAKVIGLHFQAVSITKLNNISSKQTWAMFNLLTNCEFDSIMHIHEHTCTPYTVRRTCTPYMYDRVDSA